MRLNIEGKKAIVDQVANVLSESQTTVVAGYRGLTVSQMDEIRREARDNNVYLRVVKNTLARRAVRDTGFSCLDEHLVGPMVLAASKDPVAVAKLLDKFAKSFDKLEIKAGAMAGGLAEPCGYPKAGQTARAGRIAGHPCGDHASTHYKVRQNLE